MLFKISKWHNLGFAEFGSIEYCIERLPLSSWLRYLCFCVTILFFAFLPQTLPRRSCIHASIYLSDMCSLQLFSIILFNILLHKVQSAFPSEFPFTSFLHFMSWMTVIQERLSQAAAPQRQSIERSPMRLFSHLTMMPPRCLLVESSWTRRSFHGKSLPAPHLTPLGIN